MSKPKVAFICIHNSCRSQMAEGIAKILSSDTFDSYSAGIDTSREINEDAINIIKEIYNVDLTVNQSVSSVSELPQIDIVIKMGCEVECPWLPSKHEEDWGLDDPTGLSHDTFYQTAKKIEEKVKDLEERIMKKEIDI